MDQTASVSTASRGFLERLLHRYRHGTLLQEVLDRLARMGVVVYPYFIGIEFVADEKSEPDPGPYSMRLLSAEDAAAVERITLLKTRSTSAAAVAARMERAHCVGAFHDGELVAYLWIGYDGVPTPGSGKQWLFMLEPEEAYPIEIYVAPACRGRRLAPLLRRYMVTMLRQQGRLRFYSVVLAFNTASRRFRARLPVRDVELRLYMHIRLGRLPGMDLRLWRRPPHTPAPPIKLVAARRRPPSAPDHR